MNVLEKINTFYLYGGNINVATSNILKYNHDIDLLKLCGFSNNKYKLNLNNSTNILISDNPINDKKKFIIKDIIKTGFYLININDTELYLDINDFNEIYNIKNLVPSDNHIYILKTHHLKHNQTRGFVYKNAVNNFIKINTNLNTLDTFNETSNNILSSNINEYIPLYIFKNNEEVFTGYSIQDKKSNIKKYYKINFIDKNENITYNINEELDTNNITIIDKYKLKINSVNTTKIKFNCFDILQKLINKNDNIKNLIDMQLNKNNYIVINPKENIDGLFMIHTPQKDNIQTHLNNPLLQLLGFPEDELYIDLTESTPLYNRTAYPSNINIDKHNNYINFEFNNKQHTIYINKSKELKINVLINLINQTLHNYFGNEQIILLKSKKNLIFKTKNTNTITFNTIQPSHNTLDKIKPISTKLNKDITTLLQNNNTSITINDKNNIFYKKINKTNYKISILNGTYNKSQLITLLNRGIINTNDKFTTQHGGALMETLYGIQSTRTNKESTSISTTYMIVYSCLVFILLIINIIKPNIFKFNDLTIFILISSICFVPIYIWSNIGKISFERKFTVLFNNALKDTSLDVNSIAANNFKYIPIYYTEYSYFFILFNLALILCINSSSYLKSLKLIPYIFISVFVLIFLGLESIVNNINYITLTTFIYSICIIIYCLYISIYNKINKLPNIFTNLDSFKIINFTFIFTFLYIIFIIYINSCSTENIYNLNPIIKAIIKRKTLETNADDYKINNDKIYFYNIKQNTFNKNEFNYLLILFLIIIYIIYNLITSYYYYKSSQISIIKLVSLIIFKNLNMKTLFKYTILLLLGVYCFMIYNKNLTYNDYFKNNIRIYGILKIYYIIYFIIFIIYSIINRKDITNIDNIYTNFITTNTKAYKVIIFILTGIFSVVIYLYSTTNLTVQNLTEYPFKPHKYYNIPLTFSEDNPAPEDNSRPAIMYNTQNNLITPHKYYVKYNFTTKPSTKPSVKPSIHPTISTNSEIDKVLSYFQSTNPTKTPLNTTIPITIKIFADDIPPMNPDIFLNTKDTILIIKKTDPAPTSTDINRFVLESDKIFYPKMIFENDQSEIITEDGDKFIIFKLDFPFEYIEDELAFGNFTAASQIKERINKYLNATSILIDLNKINYTNNTNYYITYMYAKNKLITNETFSSTNNNTNLQELTPQSFKGVKYVENTDITKISSDTYFTSLIKINHPDVIALEKLLKFNYDYYINILPISTTLSLQNKTNYIKNLQIIENYNIIDVNKNSMPSIINIAIIGCLISYNLINI
tara:strand:- start:1926 stop:5759 length:3834 start_codon:yes stop_codon:yes gene_type:complete